MISTETHITPMRRALEEAEKAGARNEVPVGAVLVHIETGEIISAQGNWCEHRHDPTAHAEMLVIQEACEKTGCKHLSDYDLYVTLEPCPMCAAAISFARIRRLYFGAYDPKSGGVDHGTRTYERTTCHHKPEVYGGIMEQECSDILKKFFAALRD